MYSTYSPSSGAWAWSAREAIKQVDHTPHWVVMVEIAGAHFPERGAPPFIRILENGDGPPFLCWFAEVSDDGRRLRGFFPVDLPERGVLEFGYGDKIFGRAALPFDAQQCARLEARRLPKEVVRFDRALLERKRG